MPSRRVTVAALLALTAGLRPGPVPAQVPPVVGWFDDRVLHDVHLAMHPRDLQKLRAGYLTDAVYPADLTWRNVKLRSVAVRSRGNGSRNPVKLGLAVDFDRYVPGRRYAGLAGIYLDNLWQDPTQIRERLAMSFLDRMGEPAPRESFARLYINNVLQGIYALVEPIDRLYVERHRGFDSGLLFEYRWLFAFRGEEIGEDLDLVRAMFAPRPAFGALDSEEEFFGPIRDLWQSVNQATDDPVRWHEDVEARLDLRQAVTLLAIDAYLGDLDGLFGQSGMNNFYLHRTAGSLRHEIFRWDTDHAFWFIDQSILAGVELNVLARTALSDPGLFAHFLDVVEACALTTSQDDWLLGEIDRHVALIDAAVRADRNRQHTDTVYDEELLFLRSFALDRPRIVLDEVAALRAATGGGL